VASTRLAGACVNELAARGAQKGVNCGGGEDAATEGAAGERVLEALDQKFSLSFEQTGGERFEVGGRAGELGARGFESVERTLVKAVSDIGEEAVLELGEVAAGFAHLPEVASDEASAFPG